MKDYYKILGLEPTATQEHIRRAYRHLVMQYHPDHNKEADAHQRFLEIKEAYEILSFKVRPRRTIPSPQPQRPPIIIIKRRKKENTEAKRKKEELKFKEQGIWNIMLASKYAFKIGMWLLSISFIYVPIWYAVEYKISYFFLTFPLWGTGLWFNYYILKNFKDYFNDGKFEPTHLIQDYIHIRREVYGKNCFYCANMEANSIPYKYRMFKIKNIQFQRNSSQHRKATFQADEKTILIPRCLKAVIIHRLSKAIKIISILICLFSLSFYSLFWRIIVGVLIGAALSKLLFVFTKTKSDTYFLFTMSVILRILIIMSVAFSLSDFGVEGVVETSDSFLVIMLITIFLSDFLVNSFSEGFVNEPLSFSKNKQYTEVGDLLKKGFKNGGSSFIESIFYPFYKWLF